MNPFRELKIQILSWILHRANREFCNEYFYKIKNKILIKYGKHLGYDVQFIEGKKCYSCGGTGIHHNYYHNEWQQDVCYHCFNGWYKDPVWNILSRVEFGKYIFHQPYQRAYKKPEISTNIIDGYISHTKIKYGATCQFVLFLLYEKGYLKRYYKETGIGWRTYWYYPQNWIPCIIHIIKHGTNSYPIRKIKERLVNNSRTKVFYTDTDDLPF